MNRILIYITLSVISLSGFAQNQFHMSQSMMYQPFINPAAIGSYNNLNGALFYKNQWTGFVGAPEIGGLSVNSPIKGSNHSVGFTFINDKIGISNNKDLSFMYAYKMKLNDKNYISLGLTGSMMMMQSNLANLDIIQGADPVFQANTPTYVMPNAKFGAYYFTNKFYAGFGIPNLMKNKIETNGIIKASTTFATDNIHFYIHSGYKFEINEDWDANASILLKEVSGAPLQIGLNGQFVYKELLGLGASYRTSKELVIMANYQITQELKLGYAYDFNMDDIGKYSSGTHEIILLFNIINDKVIPIIEVPRF